MKHHMGVIIVGIVAVVVVLGFLWFAFGGAGETLVGEGKSMFRTAKIDTAAIEASVKQAVFDTLNTCEIVEAFSPSQGQGVCDEACNGLGKTCVAVNTLVIFNIDPSLPDSLANMERFSVPMDCDEDLTRTPHSPITDMLVDYEDSGHTLHTFPFCTCCSP